MENTTPKATVTKPMSENAQKVLATLKATAEPMTTAELATAAGVSAAAVTGSVQGLNKRGLIEKGVKTVNIDGKDKEFKTFALNSAGMEFKPVV